LIEEKRIADANRIILDFEDEGIQVLHGRYGPYITDKARNARIPKDRDPKTLSPQECKELLAAAPMRGRRGKKKTTAAGSMVAAAATKKTATKKAKKKTKKKARKKAVRKSPGTPTDDN
jgi:DNA topoisomerase-1